MITPATAGDAIHIGIDQLKFDPAVVSAHVGDTIEWTNSDFVAHTATARNKDWDVAIPANGVGHVTLEHSGDVDYFCRFHPNMMGRISVMP
jgi:plastocyanin